MAEPVSLHLEKDDSFLNEIWAWFVVGCVTITLRYIVRIRTVGIRGFAGDDYVTIFTMAFYTMDAALVHIVYHTGANADLTPTIVDGLSGDQIQELIYGSKCQTAAWYSYTALIWCMKFTMLFFYKRLTMGTWQNRMIKYLFWLCGVTYLAVFLTITFGCHPIQDNWGVKPLPGKNCTFKVQNLLVTVTLNVITDAIILIIPIPMLWRLKVTWSRKLAIAALLSSGIFVIAAAVIRAVLTLGAAPSALNINRWGVRETIIGILTVNVPILRPLFTAAFWRPGPYHPSASGAGSGAGSAPWGSAKGRRTKSGAYGRGTFELRSASASDAEDRGSGASVYSAKEDGAVVKVVGRAASLAGSQEGIVDKSRTLSRDLEAGPGGAMGRSPTNVVFVETSYDIRTSDRDELDSLQGPGQGDVLVQTASPHLAIPHPKNQVPKMFKFLSRKQRLSLTIAISFSFFVAEISAGFYTRSLALVADAFHYVCAQPILHAATERGVSPQGFSFGWARAQLLGAFFNGVFLLALGLSIFLQSIERFISLQHVNNPLIVLIVGSVGLTLNIITAAFLHEHDHDHGHGGHSHGHDGAGEHTDGMELPEGQTHAEHIHRTAQLKPPGYDLGMVGVIVHVLGDAFNNIAVIVAALVIWLVKSDARFYADPALSTVIALMILASAIPLTKRSGTILLQSAPPGVRLDDVKHDLEMIPGVRSVHELHVWRLDQKKAIASAHVVVGEESLSTFMQKAQTVSECLHAYGIHSATLQPELAAPSAASSTSELASNGPVAAGGEGLRHRTQSLASCRLTSSKARAVAAKFAQVHCHSLEGDTAEPQNSSQMHIEGEISLSGQIPGGTELSTAGNRSSLRIEGQVSVSSPSPQQDQQQQHRQPKPAIGEIQNAKAPAHVQTDGLTRRHGHHHQGDVESQSPVRLSGADPLKLKEKLKSDTEIQSIGANIARKRRTCNRLVALRTRKPVPRANDVRKFYEDQNANIRSFLKTVDEHEQEAGDTREGSNLKYKIAVRGSLAANVVLSGLQLYGAVSTGSLSLFTTMADSIFDPLANLMLLLSHRTVKKMDPHKFPAGKARISTAGNIVFAFLMCAVSLILIVMSARELAEGQEQEVNKFHLPAVIAVGVAFGTKLALFLYCWALKDIYSQVHMLWEDHRNDLFINGFGILTSVGGSKLRWYIDPIGAIALSCLIAALWSKTMYEEFQFLIGVSADVTTQQHMTYVAMMHSDLVLKVDTVRAYHSGPRLVAEVDVVMDRGLTLQEAHDCAEALQVKLEQLPNVERAFVHVDYETTHKPEHSLKTHL
ncbi:putative cation diffusion facilitator 1 protein [Neofusicoccum parvum]|uniref:Cation diffusion facilitator 1 protein n=1 Tax=Neofusicoccum parvum TaxID=310453 RepID=A0ACB5SBQ7_9PEZI|nr:putative cation diffusion facilitator 1 protein [Neofusicoccum parvum]